MHTKKLKQKRDYFHFKTKKRVRDNGAFQERAGFKNNNDDTADPLLNNACHYVDDSDHFGHKGNTSSLDATGIIGTDSALLLLTMQNNNDQHPEKCTKAGHKAHEEKTLP